MKKVNDFMGSLRSCGQLVKEGDGGIKNDTTT